MKKPKRSLADELRGASRLAALATGGVTRVVEAMHQTIAGGPDILARPLEGVARTVTAPVYGGIQGVTKAVGAGVELVLRGLSPWLRPSAPGPTREALLAAVNGVVGDYLEESHNPLALEMRLRHGGHALTLEHHALREAFPDARRKVLVLVHGSCMSDLQWLRRGHDHGAALARDLGYTPLYLHYNSGLHISENGRAFAALLQALVEAWPVPIEALDLLTHSMGGLVSRAACHIAEDAGLGWRPQLRALVFLGTPHHGAPLERHGNWADVLLGVSRYSAPLARIGRIRSAGVTDLRYGQVLDEHWMGRDRFAGTGDLRAGLKLPEGVRCYAVAGTSSLDAKAKRPGDGMVPRNSALGEHARPELTLDFPAEHRWIARGVKHLDLLSSAEVYAKVRDWLSD